MTNSPQFIEKEDLFVHHVHEVCQENQFIIKMNTETVKRSSSSLNESYFISFKSLTDLFEFSRSTKNKFSLGFVKEMMEMNMHIHKSADMLAIYLKARRSFEHSMME